MEFVLLVALQITGVVFAYWAGRFAEQGAQLRRAKRALLGRRAEYQASDQGAVAGWTYAGWLRAFDELLDDRRG